MTGKELITKMRYRLDDVVGASSSSQWSDTEILFYAEAVQYEIAEECRCIHDATSEGCEVAVVAGDKTVQLESLSVELESAFFIYADGNTPLGVRASLQDLIDINAWPVPSVGLPSVVAPVNSDGLYAFDKELSVDGIIKVVTTRLPLNSVTSAASLELPVKYQQRIFNGMLHLAFARPDTETQSVTKSELYKKLYELDKEMIKRTENRVRPKKINHLVS